MTYESGLPLPDDRALLIKGTFRIRGVLEVMVMPGSWVAFQLHGSKV